MRFGDEIRKVGPGAIARVAPRTQRSHRNEGDEPVEMWAVSTRIDDSGLGQDRRLLGGVAGRRAGALRLAVRSSGPPWTPLATATS